MTTMLRPTSGLDDKSAACRGAECRITACLLAEFERELATTRTFLERVPADKLAWKPHAKSMTAGQLALHIAEVPGNVARMALVDSCAVPDLTRPQPASTDEVLRALDHSAETVRAALPTLTDEAMQRTWRLVAPNGQEIMAMPRVGLLRTIMLNHWYHHRGQLGVYLRLTGALVPSSYGPSGDESPFA